MAESDIEAAAAIQVDAFGGVLSDIISRYHDGPRSTWRDAWVVERSGEISAAAVAIPVRWWYRGQSQAASAIAAVAVRPVDRRRRLAHDLMHAILRRDLEQGRSFSLLFPFQHGFYRRLGYGSVGLMNFWRLPLAHLRDDPSLRANVRLLRAADRTQVEALFARSLRERPEGGLERHAAQWERRWTQTERWVVYDNGSIDGYLAYNQGTDTLEVRELVTATSEAERGLWSFVAAQIEHRASVSLLTPMGKPLWATLREPYMFEGPQHGFIINDVAGLTMSFMARGIDWRAALEPRAFPSGVQGRLDLALTDSVFGPQSLGLELADGHATIVSAADPGSVRCDVAIFSQIYCGALSATHARWYGMLEADDEAVELLDQAFPQGPPFMARFDWF